MRPCFRHGHVVADAWRSLERPMAQEGQTRAAPMAEVLGMRHCLRASEGLLALPASPLPEWQEHGSEVRRLSKA